MPRFYNLSTGEPAGNTHQQAADYAAARTHAGAVAILDTCPAAYTNLTTYRRADQEGFNGTAGTPSRALAWFDFFAGYIECAMWADAPRGDDGEELEDARDPEGEELRAIAEEAGGWFCRNFGELAKAANGAGYSWARAGHDFWLTRNGHGAGYWDRDELPDDLRDRLSDAARKAGTVTLYRGDDGLTYADIPRGSV